ncbi:MAG: DUF58 domain-containing protein [Akkermansiaceae bacterium]|jgi:uncharacterized protein (DUF58 family)|nr:DUF58 domain-containing protein [Akkermansiaceae bacterium]MDP4779387.1 DUF58 domain-containing protein [Akkermansiaceae bacterium]MDP4846727.1 DUF58 domain-containing protein [Akkermansiaceae bacterium]MDP4897064.1 DUF58 domain-containing protein [Akkermansiaceae bacterium]
MLRLPFRTRVWRGAAGEFAGSGTGASMDFQDHRAYSPGDDPRHINWNAYARTGQYSMKLFREEIRPVVDLILDASPSMFFSPEKEKRTAELLVFLADSSLAAGASVRIYAMNGDAQLAIDPMTLKSGRWQNDIKALAPTTPGAPPEIHRLPLRSHALRVLLSDLLFPADPKPILQTLGQKQGTPILFSPFTEAESAPAWTGNYDFVDAELKTKHPHRIEPATLRRYHEAYASHFNLWKDTALRHQAPLARIPCEPDLIPALYQHALPVKAVETTK